MNIFSKRLDGLMRPDGVIRFTQGEIAKAADTTQPTVGRWLEGNGGPNPEQIRALADLFGVTADYLLGRSELSEKAETFVEAETRRANTAERKLEEVKRGLKQMLDGLEVSYGTGRERSRSEKLLRRAAEMEKKGRPGDV